MTRRFGIDDQYLDTRGKTQALPDAIRHRLLEAMGVQPDAGEEPPVPMRFLSPGRTRRLDGKGTIHLEDGNQRRVEGELPEDLPLGYHRLVMEGGDEPIRLIVAPRACLLPEKKMAGFAAQLYAARSQKSWGIGDLSDL